MRILVAQAVEGERAALRDRKRLREQFVRIDAGQTLACAQMSFAVRIQSIPGLLQRAFEPDCCQRILQRPAGAHVHVHVAARHAGQAEAMTERHDMGKMLAVARFAQQLYGEPRTAWQAFGDPARLLGCDLVVRLRGCGG